MLRTIRAVIWRVRGMEGRGGDEAGKEREFTQEV